MLLQEAVVGGKRHAGSAVLLPLLLLQRLRDRETGTKG